jgi:hypothetical protein
MADEPFSLFYLPFRPALDANGIVVPGASLTFYQSGTNTLQPIYADAGLTIPLANPLTANAAGKWPSIYIDTSLVYRVVLRGALGETLDQADPYTPGMIGGPAGATGPANSTYPSAAAIRTSAPPTNLSAILASGNRRDLYVWVAGASATGANNIDTIASDLSSAGAWKRQDGPLYAGNFGVIGDAGSDSGGAVIGTDDTAAVQAFQDLCAGLNRIANYGSLRVRLTGPIVIHNGSCVFDRQSFTATGESAGVSRGEPGFYVSGSGYTALTVSGICTAFCATVCGGGDATTDVAGNITSDTRPAVVGIQFGNPLGATRGTLILSRIAWARVTKVRGTGIRVTNAFDCRFGALLTEGCGNADAYALSVEDGGNTTNESVFEYIQSEFGKQKALYISPNVLSCTFLKIHSERATGIAGTPTWVIGSGVYNSARLSAVNAAGNVLCRSQSADFTSFRPEAVPVAVDSTGGHINFNNTEGGTFAPAAGSNGLVNFYGGNFSWNGATQGWYASAAMVADAAIGACADGRFPVLEHCQTALLRRTDDTAAIAIVGGRVEAYRAGQWRDTRIASNARVALEGGSGTIINQKMTLDASSILTGNLTLNSVGYRLNGRHVGNLTLQSPNQVLFGSTAEVTGTITGTTAPEGDSYLDGVPDGTWSKNPRPTVQGTAGSQYIVTHWQKVAGAWTSCRALTGG